MYIESVRKFVSNEVSPQIMIWDRENVFPLEMIRKCWALGMLNHCIPESIKGYKLDIISSVLIIRELSYGDTGLSTSALCNDLANTAIALHGSEAQCETFLRPFVNEPLLASFCLTEPNAGSDNSAIMTFIKRRHGGYVLNGSKSFITNASYASQFTVFCKLGSSQGNFMACVIVPLPLKLLPDRSFIIHSDREIILPQGGRIIVGKPENKLGQRISNTATVTFEDVIVDVDHIIGDRRLGFKYAVNVLDNTRPMVAAIGVGLARRALDITLEYTRNRKQFGVRISDMPVARETLVKMWVKIELAELAMMKAAFKVQENAEDKGRYASLAKNTAAEAALLCAHEGLHLHGGYGFMTDYEISKLARDAHVIDIYEGVREVQNMIMGREIVSD